MCYNEATQHCYDRLDAEEESKETEFALPAEFRLLKQLKTLDISNNCITSIPDECFSGWRQLERLLASGNHLTTLTEKVASLKSLRELDLYSNRLRAIPVEIASLSQLMKLNIANNMIVELPAQIGVLPLQSLEVDSQRGFLR